MASTYENDLRLEEMATGENSGSWGTKTNTNLELIADAFSYGTEIIADADTTITIADGAADAARSLALKINSSEDLTTTRVVTLAPNTTSKVWIIENNTSGGQVLTISAGSGSNITLLNGQTKIIATDGIGAGSNVVELTQDIAIADLFVDDDLSLQSDGAVINFGADADVNLTHVADTGLRLNAAMALEFRDGDLSINSSADGQLDINADTEVEIVAPTVDIDASTAMTIDTAALTVTGAVDLNTSLNVDGDVTSDGVTVAGNILLQTEGNEVQFNTSGSPVNKIYTDDTYTTNGLTIEAETGVTLKSTSNYLLLDDSGTNEMVLNVDSGERMRVTATGIDVTGTVTADGLVVSSANANIDVSNTGTGVASQDFLTNSNAARTTIGVERSSGGGLFVGSSAYAAVFGSAGANPTQIASNNTVRMTVDTSGNVGIGTESPTTALTISTDGTEQLTINRADASINTGNTVGTILFTGDDPSANQTGAKIQVIASQNWSSNAYGSHITFSNDSGGTITERMRIGSSGDVFLGPAATGTTQNLFAGSGTTAGQGLAGFTWSYDDRSTLGLQIRTDTTFASSYPITFATTGSPDMTLDVSGNLLVGGTSAYGDSTFTVGYDGDIKASSSSRAAIFNSTTSAYNGSLVDFRVADATVGTIGSYGGGTNTYVDSSGSALSLRVAGGDMLTLTNGNLYPTTDSGVNLGLSNRHFNDLHLSGGIIFSDAGSSGTSSSNELDSYEEGTFTATLGFRTSATGSLNYTRNTFRYIKVGGSVFITGFMTWNQNNFTANTGAMQLQGLPFTFANTQLYRGGVNVVYSDAEFSGVTIYQQGFRNEQAETNMIFNFSDTTNGAMDSTIDSYSNIPSSGGMMITGTYTTL